MLITVKTYPTPAQKGIEVSCTAAITESGEWMRLFPIPFRFLEEDKRFRKYQWIEANVRRAVGDRRPESHNIDIDSIKILTEPMPTDDKWRDRKALVLPLKAHCLCCLERERVERAFPTLGIFKPAAIDSLSIKAREGEWSERELNKLSRTPLFASKPKPRWKLHDHLRRSWKSGEGACGFHLGFGLGLRLSSKRFPIRLPIRSDATNRHVRVTAYRAPIGNWGSSIDIAD